MQDKDERLVDYLSRFVLYGIKHDSTRIQILKIVLTHFSTKAAKQVSIKVTLPVILNNPQLIICKSPLFS